MGKKFSFRNSTGRNYARKNNTNRYLYSTEIMQHETPINTNEYVPTVDEYSNDEKNIPYDATVNINEYVPNIKKQNTPRH